MHETSLAKQLLSAALQSAEQEGAQRITKISGWIAETEALQPEALQFHFNAHAEQTPAAGALLSLSIEHVSARCNSCEFEYQPEHHLTLCPKCGSTDATLLGKTGLGLDSIEVE